MSEAYEAKARVRAELTDLVTIATAAIVVPAIFLIGGRPYGARATAMWACVAVVSAIWAYVAARAIAAWRTRDREVMVRAERGTLSIDGRVRFSKIGSAYLQPRDGMPPNVRVSNGLDAIDVSVGDEAGALELLRALGTDPERSVSRFRVYEGIFANKRAQTAVTMVVGIGAVNALSLLPPGIKGVGFFALAVLTVLNALRSTVLVGPDGILVVSSWRFARKFIGFANIAHATTGQWGVTLTLQSGKTIELRTTAGPKAKDETRDALLARVNAGIAALASREPSVDTATLVARGGQALDEWMKRLTAIANPATSYRALAVPAESFWRVLEDPAADPTARVGAAMALRQRLDDDGRARIRVVAENSVHPKVRVALDALAADRDEELREALGELGDSLAEPDATR
ncbi:MAG TPA: hypothetical protein VGH87_26815 [Polyangiaceae bacterium]|jgi:hypothetical protein